MIELFKYNFLLHFRMQIWYFPLVFIRSNPLICKIDKIFVWLWYSFPHYIILFVFLNIYFYVQSLIVPRSNIKNPTNFCGSIKSSWLIMCSIFPPPIARHNCHLLPSKILSSVLMLKCPTSQFWDLRTLQQLVLATIHDVLI